MFPRLKNWWKGQKGRHRIPQAHAPENVDEFAELLARSGITNMQQTNEWVSQFRAEHGRLANDVAAFCSFLVSGGHVTAWQCGKLQSGRWKGFYLDHYLMLEQVDKGRDDASYKCRDTTNGAVVSLVVTAVRLTGGRINYRVEPYSEEQFPAT